MLKYTTATLKKLENLYKQFDFKIRYEKGNFNAGYCIVRKSNVIVINKFYTTDARINCLINILKTLQELDESNLDFEMAEFFEELQPMLTPDPNPQ